MLATEDDCSGQSISENREGIDGAICAYRGKQYLARKDSRTAKQLWEAIPETGPCNIYTRKISWVSEDEWQEENHLGKQPFVPKAILNW